jgi:hypothetical protein
MVEIEIISNIHGLYLVRLNNIKNDLPYGRSFL